MTILLETYGFIKQNCAQKYLKSLRLCTNERSWTRLSSNEQSLGKFPGKCHWSGSRSCLCCLHHSPKRNGQVLARVFLLLDICDIGMAFAGWEETSSTASGDLSVTAWGCVCCVIRRK